MKATIAALALIALVAIIIGFLGLRRIPSAPTGRPFIVASFYPLGEFARHVIGGTKRLQIITPPGTEPHDYEPTPRDIVAVRSANIFIYNGDGIDTWADRLRGDLQTSGVSVIQAIDIVPAPIPHDPHAWLDPSAATKIVSAIAEAAAAADPAGADQYRQNAAAYIGVLARLDQDFRTGLSDCRTREIVVSHDAFAYLARRYNLKSVAISGISPDSEPSAARMAAIAETVRRDHVTTIFFESLISPRLADTIAGEVGVKTTTLNPIEGLSTEQTAAGQDYNSVMRQNLVSLRTALSCQ